MDIYAGPEVTVSENVTFICVAHSAMGDNCICIRGGYQNASRKSANCTHDNTTISVYSGTLSYVMGGNGATNVAGDATINIGGTALLVGRVMSAGANGGDVSGNVTINISGGEIQGTSAGKGLVLIGHGASGKVCTIGGNVTVNITGGKISQIVTTRTAYEKLEGDLTVTIGGSATVGSISLDAAYMNADKKQELVFENCTNVTVGTGFGAGWDSVTFRDNAVATMTGAYAVGENTQLNMADGSVLYLNSEVNAAAPAYHKTGAAQTGKVVMEAMHNMVYYAYKAPGAFVGGHEAYYYCSGCGKFFTDAEGTKETTLEELAIPATGGVFHNTYTEGSNYTASKLMTAAGGQGNAIFGNILITATNVGNARMYDLTTGAEIASFRLGSYNGGTLPADPDVAAGTSAGHWTNHANQIMFGASKFDENDPFPLLYVTTGNSGGHDGTGAYIAKCAIERILQNRTALGMLKSCRSSSSMTMIASLWWRAIPIRT